MSELINTQNAQNNVRWRLLSTVSALALCGSVCAMEAAKADDADRPTVWLELGGQAEHIQGSTGRFTAPFLLVDPQPAVFSPVSPIEAQRAPRYGAGFEGKASFQPKHSDWIFSAGLRYGRSNGAKHIHYQSYAPPAKNGHALVNYQLADTQGKQNENHLVVDFQAGKDVGLGMFGHNITSVFDVGIRFAQFTSATTMDIHDRPAITTKKVSQGFPGKYAYNSQFNEYAMHGESRRSFHGVGPSLSWNGSAPMIGAPDRTEFTVDWGIGGALLFGRQKADVQRTRHATHFGTPKQVLYNTTIAPVRSRSVIVPNVGGFAGLSLKFPNAKVSLGYRADFYFGAMDTGIEAANRTTTSFHGPFATFSVGLGG